MPAVSRDELQQKLNNLGIQTNNTAGGFSIGGNYGGQAANLPTLYNEVKKENEKSLFQNQDDQQGRKEATEADRIAYSVGRIGDTIRNAFGFQEAFNNAQSIPSKMVAMLPTLPFGIIGSPFAAARDIYEGVTRHDIRDYDAETNTISAKDLDDRQAAGAFADAFVETAGTLTGGSARLIGAGVGGARQLLPRAANQAVKNTVDRMTLTGGRGVITKAAQEAGIGRKGQMAMQIAADTGEEVAEEFTQSLAEDARFGEDFDLGKAAERGAWGAWGGLAMSGSAHLANAGIAKLDEKRNIESNDEGKINKKNQVVSKEADKIKDPVIHQEIYRSPTGPTVLDSQQRYANEEGIVDHDVPGSFVAKVIPNDPDMEINHFGTGIKNIRHSFLSTDDAGRDIWAKRFGVTKDRLWNVLENNDHVALQAMLDKVGGIDLVIGKNPNTSKSSQIMLTLTKINSGRGLQMSALASQFGNSDIDGDPKYVMDPRETTALRPTQLFMDPNGDPADFLQFMPRLDTDDARKKIKEILDTRFNGLIDSTTSSDIATYLSNSRMNKESAKKAANLLYNLRDKAMRSNKYDSSNIDDEISKSLNDVMHLRWDSELREGLLDNSLKSISDSLDHVVKVADKFDESGDVNIQKGTKPTELVDAYIDVLGILYSPWHATGSSMFRQVGAKKYTISKPRELGKKIADAIDVHNQDQLDLHIANLYRLAGLGLEVDNAVNTLFNLAIAEDLYEELNLADPNNRIGKNLTVEQVEKKFQEIYNRNAETFSRVIKNQTYDGQRIKFKDIVGKKTIDFNGKPSEVADARNALFKQLEYHPLSEIMYMEDASYTDEEKMMTWRELLDEQYRSGISDVILPSIDRGTHTGINEFIDYMINASDTQSMRIRSSAESVLKSLGRIDYEQAKNPVNQTELVHILTSLDEMIGPDVMAYEGIRTHEQWLNSEYREVVINGTWKERLSFVTAKRYAYKYREVFRLQELLDDPDSNFNDPDLIVQAAYTVDEGTRFSLFIANQIREGNGHSEFLDAMCDWRRSWDSKEEFFEKHGQSYSSVNEDLFTAMMRSDNSDLAVSQLSQRISRARTHADTANKYTGEILVNQVKAFKKVFKMIGKDPMLANSSHGILETFFTQQTPKMNMQIEFANILNARRLALDDAEKGKITKSDDAIFQQMDRYLNGPLRSELEKFTNNMFGRYDINDVINDRNLLIDVLWRGFEVDIDGGGRGSFHLNAETFVQSFLGENETCPNGKIEQEQFFKILDKCPQLLTRLCNEYASIAPTEKQNIVFGTESDPADMAQQYVERIGSDASKLAQEQSDAKIDLLLFNLQGYRTALAYSISRENLDDPKKAMKELMRNHEKQVERFKSLAYEERMAYREGSERNIDNYFNQTRIDLFDEVSRDMGSELSKAVATTNYLIDGNTIDASYIANSVGGIDWFISHIMANDALGLTRDWLYDKAPEANHGLMSSKDEAMLISELLREGEDEVVNGVRETYGESEASRIQAFIDKNGLDNLGKYITFESIVGDPSNAVNANIQILSLMGFDAWRLKAIKTEYEATTARVSDNIDYTSEEYIAAKTRVDNVIDAIKDGIKISDIDYRSVVFREDLFDPMDESKPNRKRIKDKVRYILDLNNMGNSDFLSAAEMESQIDELCDIIENPKSKESDIQQAWESLEKHRLYVQGIALSYNIRQIHGPVANNVDSEAYSNMMLIEKTLRDAVRDIAYDDQIELKNVKSVEDTEFPRYHFGSKSHAFMASKLRMRNGTSSIGSGVGANGVIFKQTAPLCAVSHDFNCTDDGHVYTDLIDIVANWDDIYGHDYHADIIDNNTGEPIKNGKDVILTTAFQYDSIPTNCSLKVYDGPRYCPDRRHSKTNQTPGFSDSNDTFEAITGMEDEFQEGGQLKRKKNYDDIYNIVAKSPRNLLNPISVKYENNDPDAFWNNVIDRTLEYREDATQLLKAVVSDYNEGVYDFNDVDFDGLMVGVINAAEVKFVTPAGNEVWVRIGLEYIAQHKTDTGFDLSDKYPNMIPVEAIPIAVSPKSLSDHVGYSIVHDSFGKVAEGKTVADDTNAMGENATQAMYDWSNFNARGLNIADYFMSAPAKGQTFPTQIVPTDNKSLKQRWIKLKGQDGGIEKLVNPKSLKAFNANEKGIDTIVEKSHDLLPKPKDFDEDVVITHIELNEDEKFLGSRRKLRELKDALGHRDGFRVNRAKAAYLIASEDSKKIDAILKDSTHDAWNYDFILIREDSVSRESKKKYVDARARDIDGEHYLLISTDKRYGKNFVADDQFIYSETTDDISREACFLIDNDNDMMLGDGPLVINPDALSYLNISITENIDISLQKLRGGIKNKNGILTRTELRFIRELFTSDNENLKIVYDKEKFKVDDKYMLKELKNFLDCAASQSDFVDEKGFRSGFTESDSIMGIASCKIGDRYMIYPILNTSGNAIKITDVYRGNDNNVIFEQDTPVSDLEEAVLKVAIRDMAFKGQLAAMTDEQLANALRIDIEGFDRFGYLDGSAMSNRNQARGKDVVIQNHWFLLRNISGSLRNDIAKQQMDPYYTEVIEELGNRSRIDYMLSEPTNVALWNDVANGTRPIFLGDRNIPVNRAIRDLAIIAKCNGVVLPVILETHYNAGSKDVLRKRVTYTQIQGILGRLNQSDLRALFIMMNNDVAKLMNEEGDIRVIDPKTGNAYFHPCVFREMITEEENTATMQTAGTVNIGMQSLAKLAMRHGIPNKDKQRLLDYINANYGGEAKFNDLDDKTIVDNVKERYNNIMLDEENVNLMALETAWANYTARSELNDAIAHEIQSLGRIGFKVKDKDKTISFYGKRVTRLKSSLEKALGIKQGLLSDIEFAEIIRVSRGYSEGRKGKGNREIQISDIESIVNNIDTRVRSSKYFISGDSMTNDYISIALVSRRIAMSIYGKADNLQKIHGDFKEFEKAAFNELEVAKDTIDGLNHETEGMTRSQLIAKKRALNIMIMARQRTYGVAPEVNELLTGMSDTDFFEYKNELAMIANKYVNEEDVLKMEQQQEETRKTFRNLRKANADRRNARISNNLARDGKVTTAKNSSNVYGGKILSTIESWIRLNALLDPILMPLANAIEGAGHTFFIKLGLRNGLYSDAKGLVDYELASEVIQDDELVTFYKGLMQAKLLGKEDLFIREWNTRDDKEEFFKELYAGENGFERFSNKAFQWVSATNLMARQQLQIAIMRFGMWAEENDIREQTQIITTDSDGKEYSKMEWMLRNGEGVQWLIDTLDVNKASHSGWRMAMNFSAQSAMARENVVSALTSELFKRRPYIRFASTAFFTPFYRYVTNQVGRVMNWILPMSSLNYLVVEKLGASNIKAIQNIDFESLQVYGSLKRALIADALHMTPLALCMLLSGTLLSALFTPPDDEDKANDYREWLFCGQRIYPDWPLQDACGIALPLAITCISISQGKPRLDILFQGLATVLSNNPLMHVNDVIDVILEPDVLKDQWEEEIKKYENAKAGSPDTGEWAETVAECGFMNFLGRVVTPSILKNIFRTMQDDEVSYKRVYESKEGDDTELVSYKEAQLRKMARNNPFLGWMLDFVRNPDTTSYSALGNPILGLRGMPSTEYQDNVERYIMHKYSIYDYSTGKRVEKSETEKQQVAFDIIATLEAHDDMDELRNSGFVIDSATKHYVSQVLWDLVQAYNDEWYSFANSSESDYYLLGEGDYWTGRQIKYQLQQEWQNKVSYIKNTLYYGKLWSSAMKKPITTYNRINTTYQKDVNGNYYATGYKKGSGLVLVKTADGSLDNPGKTMGYEGDWATPSVVEGESTYERGLYLADLDYEETPSWDSLGNNNGSSSSGANGSGSQSSGNLFGSNSDGSGGSGKSGGSKSGGGSRRGGGGGGGGSNPNIYSRLPKLNVSSPKTSNSSRLNNANFDYLRPNFETKGSREASKRSDF